MGLGKDVSGSLSGVAGMCVSEGGGVRPETERTGGEVQTLEGRAGPQTRVPQSAHLSSSCVV